MSHLRQYFSFGSPPFPLESLVIKTRTLSKSASPRTGAHWSAKASRTSARASQEGSRVVIGPCCAVSREPCLDIAKAADKRQSEDRASVWLQDGFQKRGEESRWRMLPRVIPRFTSRFGCPDRQARQGARKGPFGALGARVETGPAIGHDSIADAAFPSPVQSQSGNMECKLPCY